MASSIIRGVSIHRSIDISAGPSGEPCLVYNPSRNEKSCSGELVFLRKCISGGHLFVRGNASPEASRSGVHGAANRVPRKSYSLVPVVLESPGNRLTAKRVTVVPYSGRHTKLGSSQHCYLRSCGIYSSTTSYSLGTPRSWHAGLESTSIKAVTTAYDSSSGDGLGSSAHATDLPPVWSGIGDLKSFLGASLQGWKERGLLQSSKEGFDEAYAKLKTLDKKRFLKDVSESEVVKQGARAWQTLDPWIKWPIVIFGAAYLVVLASFGLVVAQDLTPLWLLGPLLMCWMIRSAHQTAHFAHKCMVNSEPFRLAAMQGAVQIYEDYKRGELFDKLGSLIESKNRDFKDGLTKKRSDLILYVKSGQAAVDFKVFVLLRFTQLNDWRIEKYEDFVEWVRPFWRAFVRLVKKIF